MSPGAWVTNSHEAARQLAAADRRYSAARAAAADLPLCQKVAAYRAAREALQADYSAIVALQETHPCD